MKLIYKWMIVIVACLAGCNAPTVKISTPRSVVVKSVPADLDKALMLAEAECVKHNRHARYNPDARYTGLASFDCVE